MEDADSLCPGARVFSTCPNSAGQKDYKRYKKSVIRTAQWSEDAGCQGMLVYTDNATVDPWLTAQIILENTFHPESPWWPYNRCTCTHTAPPRW